MRLLIANWKYVLIAALTATTLMFYNLWQGTKEDFTTYKTEVRVLGEEAERKAKEIEDHQQKVLEDVSNAWNAKLPKVREDAVAAYKRRYPNLGLRLPNAGSGEVSRTSNSSQSSDGASQESVVTCTQQFISDSAEDSMKIDLWQTWARENNLKVK